MLLVVILGSRFGRDPRLVPSPLIGRPSPALTLALLSGNGELDLPIEGQPVVVNFWASWCLPCRAEHPELVATAAAFAERGVRFVGIVYQDDPANAIAFLNELGWGQNYSYVLDPDSRAAIGFGVFGIPETFFVDPDGIIAAKITGQANALVLGNTLEQMLAGVRPGEKTLGTVQTGRGG